MPASRQSIGFVARNLNKEVPKIANVAFNFDKWKADLEICVTLKQFILGQIFLLHDCLLMCDPSVFNDVYQKLTEIEQSHLLRFWDDLNEDQRHNLLKHLTEIEFDGINELFNRAKSSKKDVDNLDKYMEQVPDSVIESEERCSDKLLRHYRKRGLEEIANGHVGVLLLAGGQGTRLGVEYPKGMLSVGLPSGKTLFQLQAERIQRLETLASRLTGKSGTITWYIMTSGPTDEATEAFFKKHRYFGLNPNNIVMFKQGLLPCFTSDGKIILEDKDTVALAPDGNGGVYKALEKNGILNDMRKRKVKYVHVYCVDNILVKVGDPVFVGYCVEKGADCAAKVVQKKEPSEGLGVVCKVNGHYQVVEYSEISKETSELCDEKSHLIFSAGNICNHFFTTDFLQVIADKYESQMKLHIAKKKVDYIGDLGHVIKPKAPNGIKIEKFIFDVFPFTDKLVLWEVSRISEFSAIKNPDDVGKECPSIACRNLLALHKTYIEKAGGKVIGEEVEVSPLVSYAGENLEEIVAEHIYHSPFSIDCDSLVIENDK